MRPGAEYALLCPVQRLWSVQSVSAQHCVVLVLGCTMPPASGRAGQRTVALAGLPCLAGNGQMSDQIVTRRLQGLLFNAVACLLG